MLNQKANSAGGDSRTTFELLTLFNMDGMPLEMAHSRQSSFVARIPGPKDFRPGWVLPFVSRKSPESDCNPSWDRRFYFLASSAVGFIRLKRPPSKPMVGRLNFPGYPIYANVKHITCEELSYLAARPTDPY